MSRTYFRVPTPTALLEVHRDNRVGNWYLQRVINWRRSESGPMGVYPFVYL